MEKNKTIRLIALDMDRTLLNKEGKLSTGNRLALERAISAGVEVCIASGRSFDSLPEDVVTVPGIRYAITGNGVAVHEIPEKKRLYSRTMTEASVEKVLEVTKGEPICYECFIQGKAYADARYVKEPIRFGASPKAVEYVQKTRTLVEDMPAFLRCHKTELDGMDLIVKEETVKNRLQKMVKDSIEDIYVTSSFPQLVEISHRDGGKHSGLRFLANYLGIAPEEIAAFGDADNDLEMLQFAGVGIAMENATPALLAVADRIAPHHDLDGVARILEELL